MERVLHITSDSYMALRKQQAELVSAINALRRQ